MSDDQELTPEELAWRKALTYHILYDALVEGGYKGIDRDLLNTTKLIKATPEGEAVFELTITEEMANPNGVLHGGAAAVIIDCLSSSAMCIRWNYLSGVSRTLNLSYLRAVPIGSKVWVKSRVVSAGSRMGLILSEITAPEEGGVIYVTAEHHKVMATAPKPKL